MPSGSPPDNVKASVWQMPVAIISTSTSPSRGPSKRTVSIVNGSRRHEQLQLLLPSISPKRLSNPTPEDHQGLRGTKNAFPKWVLIDWGMLICLPDQRDLSWTLCYLVVQPFCASRSFAGNAMRFVLLAWRAATGAMGSHRTCYEGYQAKIWSGSGAGRGWHGDRALPWLTPILQAYHHKQASTCLLPMLIYAFWQFKTSGSRPCRRCRSAGCLGYCQHAPNYNDAI